MHKIKKNIKKKIKGKKGKNKEDDLFDPEQLAKYKEELDRKAAEKAAAAEEAGDDQDYSPTQDEPSSSGGLGTADHEGDDEWKKFKLLTSGIDDVLKKTSGDLNRIKESSYFQRVDPKSTRIFPPGTTVTPNRHPNQQYTGQGPSSTFHHQDQPLKKKQGGHWVNVEGSRDTETHPQSEQPTESHETELQSPQVDEDHEQVEETADSPEPIQLDDDLFDTTFVDKVATGDIKLSYIPESPVLDKDDGDDPFDTSAVAHVVKVIEEAEKKQKRQVNLGLAVNVLTGKGTEETLNSFNTVNNGIKEPTSNRVGVVKGDSSKKKRRPRPHHINLLGSFDGSGPTQLSPSEDDNKNTYSPPTDFLTILGSPSENLPEVAVPFVKDIFSGEVHETSASASGPSDNIHVEESGLNLKELLSEFDVISDVSNGQAKVKEPFSLAAALNENVEDDFEDEFAALAVESLHKDNQGPHQPTKTKDQETAKELNKVASAIVTPTSPDPFDTTFVQVEESSEVTDVKVVDDNDDDFDFNPREGEPEGVEVTVVDSLSSLTTQQKDLLGGSSTDLTVLLTSVDPIQPESDGLIETEIHDPFDTTIVDGLLPGKAELKLLEEELLKQVEQQESEQPQPQLAQQSEEFKNTVTAVLNKFSTINDDDDDDFDPRQGEVDSILEQPVPHSKGPQRPPPPVKVPEIHPLDLDVDDESSGLNIIDNKTLTPQVEIAKEDEEEQEIDPFDTSSIPAHVILPGKLELKLLESELGSVNSTFNNNNTTISGETDDFEFDPRQDEVVTKIPNLSVGIDDSHDIFDAGESDFFQAQPLQPNFTNQPKQVQGTSASENTTQDDIFDADDPFDTSNFVTESLLPGKAELKFLESELLNSTADYQPPSLPKIAIVYQPTLVHQPTPIEIQEKQLETQQSLHPLEIEDDTEHSFAPLQPLTPSQFEPAGVDDPFDTSIANSIVPGKAELKILEAELGFDPAQRRLSDPDFNPRTNPIHHPFKFNNISAPLIPQTVLQPQQSSSLGGAQDESEIDPFDTSVANVILPGKAELKMLEAELL